MTPHEDIPVVANDEAENCDAPPPRLSSCTHLGQRSWETGATARRQRTGLFWNSPSSRSAFVPEKWQEERLDRITINVYVQIINISAHPHRASPNNIALITVLAISFTYRESHEACLG
ncbi:hypothetical protein AVEN_45480-1 [Araneus ventricosus]|uniref:Uncharacterized protein n=1 Tax=Araneus ventricosus TaxID=182803 RepID=A0A4Y2MA81_ARAVE|nr:hypothetical protein AVEN_45480-1 [Araneus ventricosus]